MQAKDNLLKNFKHPLFCLTSTPFIFLAACCRNGRHSINVEFAKGKKKSLEISVGNLRNRVVGGGDYICYRTARGTLDRYSASTKRSCGPIETGYDR